MKKMQNNTKYALIIGFLAVLAAIISVCARFTALFPGDLFLTGGLQSSDNLYLFLFMWSVSFLFSGWGAVLLIVFISVLVWWRIGRLEGILIPVAGLLSFVSEALKLIINHGRPSTDIILNTPASAAFMPVSQPDNGFPSGHVFFAIVILGLLVYFIFIELKKSVLRTLILIGLIALIILAGVSVIYLGYHWNSDVLGGYIIGGVFLTALIWFYRDWKVRHRS
jgi:membrane-associated phospholipid phosphatase